MNIPPINYGVIKEIDNFPWQLMSFYQRMHITFIDYHGTPAMKEVWYALYPDVMDASTYLFLKVVATIRNNVEGDGYGALLHESVVVRYRLKSQLEQKFGLPRKLIGGGQPSKDPLKLNDYFENIPPKIMTLEQKTFPLVDVPPDQSHLFFDHINY